MELKHSDVMHAIYKLDVLIVPFMELKQLRI